MSCNGNSTCVCNVVRDIVSAQDEVTNNNGGCCSTSCEQSIRDLLSPSTGNNNATGYTTIPFILYCKENCSPFISSSVYQAPIGNTGNTYFGCVETPVFRAKKFVDDGDCCVILELLLPATEGGATIDRGNEVCDFFPGNSRRDFQATGICITVDLNCFCAIQCLDPITPLPASQFAGNAE